ncbi:hypothetical protein M0802_014384 [Mischocyttarus mexicanus]|nr:hypothetical protein M0802_014384 [Mischocyttarus mexicanus]
MEEPRPGGTAFMITVTSAPGNMSIVVIMRIIAASKGTMLRSLAVQYSGDVRKVLQPRDYHDFKEIDKIEIIHDAKGKRDI